MADSKPNGFDLLIAHTTVQGREASLAIVQADMLAKWPGSVACPIVLERPETVPAKGTEDAPHRDDKPIQCFGVIKGHQLQYPICPRIDAHEAIKHEAVRRGWYTADALGLVVEATTATKPVNQRPDAATILAAFLKS
jgi:hypothetical protein